MNNNASGCFSDLQHLREFYLARIGPRELTLKGDIGGPPRSELRT